MNITMNANEYSNNMNMTPKNNNKNINTNEHKFHHAKTKPQALILLVGKKLTNHPSNVTEQKT